MTDILRTRPLDQDDRESINIIHASGQTLARQIDDILDLSKIEAGHLTLENIKFDLYVMINTTLRVFQPQVEAKHIQLRLDIDPDTPYSLNGDPHKLRQIIINLVGNAIKFTDKGYVSLRVSPKEISNDQARLKFEVSDSGIGISPDRLEAIFEPFTQANSGVTRNFGGTGLGTTICKNLVELMDGTIGVDSTPGVGTTFWFELPFMVTKEPLEGTAASWTKNCRALYIHPSPDAHTQVTESMAKWGIPFERMSSIEEAHSLIEDNSDKHTPYDAVIYDNADDHAGLEDLLKQLKDRSYSDTTSVILVNMEHFTISEQNYAHGQIHKLPTPLNDRLLFNILHACNSRYGTEEDIVHIAHHQIKNENATRPLKILIGDDNATNRIVLERMLDKLGHQCTVVNGGEEILHELEKQQFDTVIADKNMPDLGGIETFQAYSLAQGGYPETRFIILTADATEESRAQCKSAGIELFLTKPVSLARLQECLSNISATVLTSDDIQAEDRQAGQINEESLPVVNDNDFDNLVMLADNNLNFIHEIINNFETDAYEDIRGMEAAVASHDWQAFRDYAHALKGSALYLGLAQLAQLSLEAQHVDRDAFERSGIACILSIRRAADNAILNLKEKERTLRKTG